MNNSKDPFKGILSFTTPELIKLLVSLFLGAAAGYFFDRIGLDGETEPLVVTAIIGISMLIFAFIMFKFTGQAYQVLSDFSKEQKRQLKGEKEEIDRLLSGVHATVKFIEDDTNKAAYEAAKAAVLKSRNRILVVSDYSPPGKSGSELDYQETRDTYLDKILEIIEKRTKELSRIKSTEQFEYLRIIQRPQILYDYLRNNIIKNNAMELRQEYMVGDKQMFEHIKEFFELRSANPNVKKYLITHKSQQLYVEHGVEVVKYIKEFTDMVKNKIQFHAGYSLFELFQNYGTEEQCQQA